MIKVMEVQKADALAGIHYTRGGESMIQSWPPFVIPKNHKIEVIIKRNYKKK